MESYEERRYDYPYEMGLESLQTQREAVLVAKHYCLPKMRSGLEKASIRLPEQEDAPISTEGGTEAV